MKRSDVVAAFDFLAEEVDNERVRINTVGDSDPLSKARAEALLLFFERRIQAARLIAKGREMTYRVQLDQDGVPE